uniref:PSI-J n=1 Tax=Odontella aurita TaxID=265563 RepID=A0A7S4MMY7_9STRA|mmetsp:Transcript_2637/g.6900  ORF Transcript_2637/g.6900 Transcript_2637/m.6900 type:complete len:115 (+) Transcript_2637:229-573(+)
MMRTNSLSRRWQLALLAGFLFLSMASAASAVVGRETREIASRTAERANLDKANKKRRLGESRRLEDQWLPRCIPLPRAYMPIADIAGTDFNLMPYSFNFLGSLFMCFLVSHASS